MINMIVKKKYPVKNNPTKKLFQCTDKNETNHNCMPNIMQGIIYPDGTICIGVDAWRDLDKHDCSSHPVRTYQSMNEVFHYYNLILNKKNTN